MNTIKKVLIFGSAMVAATVLLAGCGGGGSGGGSGGATSAPSGGCGINCGPNVTPTYMDVSLFTSPVVGLQHVYIDVSGVELVSASGQTVQIPPDGRSSQIDLLDGGVSAAGSADEDQYDISPGSYTKIVITLVSGASHDYVVTADGDQYPLTVPSQIEIDTSIDLKPGDGDDYDVGISLPHDLVITAGSDGVPSYSLVVKNPKLVNGGESGMITGTVDPATTIGGQSQQSGYGTSACDPEVYVWQGSPAKLSGYDVQVSGGAQPYEAAGLTTMAGSGAQMYWVNFLPAGQYTVALVCAGEDTTGAASLPMTAPTVVTVGAQTDEQVNF